MAALKRPESPERDGVRTARETAAHTVCLSLGVHASRALGWNSNPVKLLTENLEPKVRYSWSSSPRTRLGSPLLGAAGDGIGSIFDADFEEGLRFERDASCHGQLPDGIALARCDHATRAQGDRPFQHILQLPHVARK